MNETRMEGVDGPRALRERRGRAGLPAAIALLALASATGAWAGWPDKPQGPFEGFWAISGTAQALEYGDGRVALAGRITGPITVQTAQGAMPSFETDCLVFFDSIEGAVGRCIWTSTTGDKVFVDIDSTGPPGSGQAAAVLTGGTGRFRTIAGRMSFIMPVTASGSREVRLDGQSYVLRGDYRLE